jgi:TPP-dependent indolepyruvate ferredoxin oxidoreductase alpha subunit
MTEAEKKTPVATVALMVTRDSMTHLHVVVPAHELEVMSALHGQENVRVLDEKTEAVELELTAEGERLEQKYGKGLIRELFGADSGRKVAKLAAEHEVKPAKKTDKTAA